MRWLVLPIFFLCACTNPTKTPNSGAQSAVNTPAPPSGFVLLREYVDSVKTPSGDQYQKVQYGWDYDQGSAVQKFFSLDGALIREEVQPGITLATSPAELEYAFALVRAEPSLQSVIERSDVRIYGGFSYREPDAKSGAAALACGAKSRCIHVILSGGVDGEVALGHAIVDLASRKVVDPKYQGDEQTVERAMQ